MNLANFGLLNIQLGPYIQKNKIKTACFAPLQQIGWKNAEKISNETEMKCMCKNMLLLFYVLVNIFSVVS